MNTNTAHFWNQTGVRTVSRKSEILLIRPSGISSIFIWHCGTAKIFLQKECKTSRSSRGWSTFRHSSSKSPFTSTFTQAHDVQAEELHANVGWGTKNQSMNSLETSHSNESLNLFSSASVFPHNRLLPQCLDERTLLRRGYENVQRLTVREHRDIKTSYYKQKSTEDTTGQKKPGYQAPRQRTEKKKQWAKIKQVVLEQYKLPMSVGQTGDWRDISWTLIFLAELLAIAFLTSGVPRTSSEKYNKKRTQHG